MNNFEIGKNYYYGINGYPEDLDKAVFFLKKAYEDKRYEAAYFLGLCYSDDLPDDRKDIKLALDYMVKADFHYVDEATEWLAEYYEDKDIEKFFDYALDVPYYLNSKSALLIKKASKRYDMVQQSDPLSVIDSIDLFEFWWKRISDKNCPLCRDIATYRNRLLQQLCDMMIEYINDSDTEEIIENFLSKYEKKNSPSFVRPVFFKATLFKLQNSINNASTLSEVESLLPRIDEYEGEYHSNLLGSYDRKRFLLYLNNDSYTNDDIQSIRSFFSAKQEDSYLIDWATKEIENKVEDLLIKNKIPPAKKLCEIYPELDPQRYKLYSRIITVERGMAGLNKPETQEEQFLRNKKEFYSSPTLVTFSRVFLLGNHLSKYDDLIQILLFAKKNEIPFESLISRSYYTKDFFVETIGKMPHEFFEDDIRNIKNEIRRRGIKALIHFSPIENLDSIVTHGLLSREELKKRNISTLCTDDQRLDGFLDHISLSITRSNYRMIWNKIYGNIINKGIEIFFIDPAILYEHPEKVIYSNCNASSKYAIGRMKYGYQGLLSMFESSFDHVNSSNIPTDVQAEVLFEKHIDKKYILDHYSVTINNDGNKISVYNPRR